MLLEEKRALVGKPNIQALRVVIVIDPTLLLHFFRNQIIVEVENRRRGLKKATMQEIEIAFLESKNFIFHIMANLACVVPNAKQFQQSIVVGLKIALLTLIASSSTT